MMMDLEIFKVITTYIQGEASNFILVWLTVLPSLSFSYFISRNLPAGLPRFLSILPLICLNFYLPLHLHTLHLGGSTSFFLAWLSNFKLLMLAFGRGPLSHPSLSLSTFLPLACLPIRFQESSSKVSPHKGLKPIWNYAIKGLLIAILLQVYDYSEFIHPRLILAIYCAHIYFGLELILGIAGGLVQAGLGMGLEPQFDEPYLSSSLQDFWGRRWNIMVARILHPAVYEPVRNVSRKIMGRRLAALPAVFCSFAVSGLMHEVIFFYIGRDRPTGLISCFFLLHGLCLAAEIALKIAIGGRWRLPRVVSGPLAVGFVMMTSFWLFFPDFLRFNTVERAFQEYATMTEFVKDVGRALALKSLGNANATTS